MDDPIVANGIFDLVQTRILAVKLGSDHPFDHLPHPVRLTAY